MHYLNRQAEYFQVSMDELGLIDVPTCLHYVLEKSGAKKLNILTHSQVRFHCWVSNGLVDKDIHLPSAHLCFSVIMLKYTSQHLLLPMHVFTLPHMCCSEQGGTLAYIALSSFPDLQAKVNSLVAMGPPCFLEYMKAAVIQNQAQARSDHLFYVVGMGGFLTSRRLWPWIRQFNRSWWADGFASALWLTFYGPSWRIPPDDQVVISNTWPATVTSRDITHWAQVRRRSALARRGRYYVGVGGGGWLDSPQYFVACSHCTAATKWVLLHELSGCPYVLAQPQLTAAAPRLAYGKDRECATSYGLRCVPTNQLTCFCTRCSCAFVDM